MQMKKHQVLAALLGFAFFSASMLGGGKLGRNLEIQDFLIAVLVGNFALCLYTGLLAYMAADTGLSIHLLARYSFGEKGSYLVSFLLGATQVGWLGIGVAMLAVGNMGGISGLLESIPAESMGMSAAISIGIGSFISAGTLAPDFIRFSKNKKVAGATTAIAFLIVSSLMLGLGAVGAKVTSQADISESVLLQGLMPPVMIGLGILNKLIPSIGGVIIADYFILRKGKYMPMENTVFISVNKIAILAWALGVAAAYFLPGIAPINSVVTAIIAYVGITKFEKMMRTEIGMQNSL